MSYVQVVDFEVGDWSFISCGWRWKPPSLPEIKRERRAAIVTVAWKNSVSGGVEPSSLRLHGYLSRGAIGKK